MFFITGSFTNPVTLGAGGGGEGRAPPPAPAVVRLNFLADIFGSSEGTDVFGKEAIKSQSGFQRETLTAPKLW